jgi:hypothetical protein
MLTASTDGHYAQIATKRNHRFGEGRIELSADIYNTDGENISGNSNIIHMMIGIGPSANDSTTKWFHMKNSVSSYVETIDAGWVANNASLKNFMVMSKTGSKIGPSVIKTIAPTLLVGEPHIFAAIPTDAGLRGKIFVRFFGRGDSADAEFFIANFKLEFTEAPEGYLTIAQENAMPVAVYTASGSCYPIEKGSLSKYESGWRISIAPYLAYDNVSRFSGTWYVYCAGGVKGDTGSVEIVVSKTAPSSPVEGMVWITE